MRKSVFFGVSGVFFCFLCIALNSDRSNLVWCGISMLLAWTFVGGWFTVGTENDSIAIFKQIYKADKEDYFYHKIEKLEELYRAVISRESYFSEEQSDCLELYYSVKNNMEANLKVVCNYLKSYDYVSKPEAVLLEQIIKQNKELVNKLNVLVDYLVCVDATAVDCNVGEIDDAIEALQSVLKKSI